MYSAIIIALLGVAQLALSHCQFPHYRHHPPCECKHSAQPYEGQESGLYDSTGQFNLPSGLENLQNFQNLPDNIQNEMAHGMEDQMVSYRPAPNPNLHCVTHQVERRVRPVLDECVRHVPILRKRLRHQEEQYTRHVPVVEKMFSQQEEKYIRHIPIVQKYCKPVVETRTRHVPVIKKRLRTVVEPYTSHVPILEKYTRPVEETVVRNIPVLERRCRPIIHQHLRHIPVTERRMRPFVESTVCQVPVKQRVLKNMVEQRIRTVQGPCQACTSEQSSPLSLSLQNSEQSQLSQYRPSPGDVSLPACGLPPFPPCPPNLSCPCSC